MQRERNIQNYFSRPYEPESTQRFLPSDIISEIKRYTYNEYDMIKEMLEDIFSFIKVPAWLNIEAMVPGAVQLYYKYYGNSIEEFLEKFDKKIRKEGLAGLIDSDHEFSGALFRYLFIEGRDMYDRVNNIDYKYIYSYLGYLLVEEGYVDTDVPLNDDNMRNIFSNYIRSLYEK